MPGKSQLILINIFFLLLNSFVSSGQEHQKQADKKTPLHYETPDDKYMPAKTAIKKTSPAYKYKQISRIGTFSGIVTVQVNVDSNQQNILGDAANEPNMSVNPLNENLMAIGWRQFDNVLSNFRQAGWAYTTDSGQSWNFPGVINPGIFRSDPVLDYDSAGNFYYYSLTSDTSGNFLCKIFKSINAGADWDTGVVAGGGDKNWMTIDRNTSLTHENIYASWASSSSVCPPFNFTRSSDGGASYENCTFIDGDPVLGTMAVGNAGELYISGFSDSDKIVVSKSINVQPLGSTIAWNTPVKVFMDKWSYGSSIMNPAGLLGQVNLEVDHSFGSGRDNVYMLASAGRASNFDPSDVMFVRSTDGGLTWNPPLRVNDDSSFTNTQWLATMSVAPNGRIDAIWLDNREAVTGSDSSALYYSFSIDQGNTWSVNEKLSALFDPHVGYPNQNKMGDYFDMISENSRIHLAWANTLNGEQDVYYSYITPPISASVEQLTSNVSVSVFPNPTSGMFTITGGVLHSRIELLNILGEIVNSFSITEVTMSLDISFQPAGVYFLKIIRPDNSLIIKKIVKG